MTTNHSLTILHALVERRTYFASVALAQNYDDAISAVLGTLDKHLRRAAGRHIVEIPRDRALVRVA